MEGSPGDRVNLSCVGVSDPTRWVWAPSFPACKGLSKGRRPILWATSSGTRSVLPHFSGRLRSLDTGIKRLELLLNTGDSGTFFCKGRQENESRTVLQVLGDQVDCRNSGFTHGRSRPRDTEFGHTPGTKSGAGSCRAGELVVCTPDLVIPPRFAVSPGSGYAKVLIPLLGVGLVLGLGASGLAWSLRR